jgi:hypothetical protein
MGKGMEGGGYDMSDDYGRGAAAAAGYGGVPSANPMSRGPPMEGAQAGMGMGMYGNMAGYGGYMGSAPAMYQQQPPPSTGPSSPPRVASDGGYIDAYGPAGVSNGAAGAPNSNYGGGNRPPSSSTTQARVDRSYRPY